MKIEDIDFLLSQIRKASGLDEFVVIGSLSALGIAGDQLPPRMTWSMEVDAYPERDPRRAQNFPDNSARTAPSTRRMAITSTP